MSIQILTLIGFLIATIIVLILIIEDKSDQVKWLDNYSKKVKKDFREYTDYFEKELDKHLREINRLQTKIDFIKESNSNPNLNE